MNLSPTLQRSPSLRRTTSSLRNLQRRTNWTLVVVLLTVLHLSATFLYYTFLAGKGDLKQGGSPKKVNDPLFLGSIVILNLSKITPPVDASF